MLAQLVDLAHSHLSGKMQDIPENILDLDPDWEIDPDALVLLEKIGAPLPLNRSCLGAPIDVAERYAV